MVAAANQKTNFSAMPWRVAMQIPLRNFILELRLYGFKEHRPECFALELFATAPGRDAVSLRHFMSVAPPWMRAGNYAHEIDHRARKWAIAVLKRSATEIVKHGYGKQREKPHAT
jgi:hypothetical protein